MTSSFLSRFTPSLDDPKTLEAIFVQREAMAARRIDQIRESVLTPAKHYALLVGPRGIGKTHLIALIYHRLKKMDDLRNRLRIAWLQEEEWGAASFLDLLIKILNALANEAPDQSLAARVEALYGQPPAAAQRQAGLLLKEYIGDRTLLILVENLDDLFLQIGGEGQKRLRAYLQENPFCTILASGQSLTGAFTLQTSPFYGFFTHYPLSEFQDVDSFELLRKIAEWQNDEELAAFIGSPEGHARIRALRHLAGGNPRIYVVFSQFMTRKSLDELVEPFMEMLDDLTPYYQDRLRVLSPQQKKIVEFLCDHAAPATVKEIARRCFITSQTASGQLRDLRARDYVHAIEVGRESYYELSEPLMRLVFEVKKSRGEPTRLFVDFLRIWHTPSELHEQFSALSSTDCTERDYLALAIRANDTESNNPRLAACVHDYRSFRASGDYSRALDVCDELIAIRGDPHDLLEKADCLVQAGRFAEGLDVADRIIDITPRDHWAWALRARSLQKLGRSAEALAAASEATHLGPTCVGSRYIEASILEKFGRYQEALAALDHVTTRARRNRAVWAFRGDLYLRQEDHEAALEAYGRAIKLGADSPCLHFNRATALLALGRWDEGLPDLATVLGRADLTAAHISVHTRLMLSTLLERDWEVYRLRVHVGLLIKLYADHRVLDALGQALARAIPATIAASMSETKAQSWSLIWVEEAGERAEFEVPLRLLDVAVRWRHNRDPRILLELPSEIRSVLEPLLEDVDHRTDHGTAIAEQESGSLRTSRRGQ